MEVTITIPDEFAERLIPAGKDVLRLLMERLVDRACDDGRIGSEEANEQLLGRAAKVGSQWRPFGTRKSPAAGTLYAMGVPLLTSEAVLTEVFHLAARERIGCEDAWEFVD